MTTLTAEPATPNAIYVPGENIEEVINSLDDDLIMLSVQDRQGDYIKFDRAFDVILDVRNKLQELLN